MKLKLGINTSPDGPHKSFQTLLSDWLISSAMELEINIGMFVGGWSVFVMKLRITSSLNDIARFDIGLHVDILDNLILEA